MCSLHSRCGAPWLSLVQKQIISLCSSSKHDVICICTKFTNILQGNQLFRITCLMLSMCRSNEEFCCKIFFAFYFPKVTPARTWSLGNRFLGRRVKMQWQIIFFQKFADQLFDFFLE